MQTTENKPVRPSTHLAIAILVTILCCLPLGVVSIVYAAQVDSNWNAGRYDVAEDYSNKAKNWAFWGLGIGVLWWILYIILLSIGVMASLW